MKPFLYFEEPELSTFVSLSLAPWLILGAVYRHLGEPLQLLWNADVHNNTVHVNDVCRAIWHVCVSQQVASGDIFNVVDDGDTTVGDLAEITANLFEIKYKFVGKMLSTLAKVCVSVSFLILIISTSLFFNVKEQLDLRATAEDANDKHLPPWAEICQLAGINNTPLTPYA